MARIALVHDVAGVALMQAKLLRGAGHEVDQIPLPAWGASWRWPAKAFALPVRLAAYAPVARRLRRARYDVVHIHYLSHGIVGVLARRPFFAQAHGSDLHVNLRSGVYRAVTRSVVENAKAVFYVTPNLPAYLDGYRAKLIHLPNPVEAGPVAAPPPAAVKRALIFTRLHPVKGVEQIFQAVERLHAMGIRLTGLEYGPLAPRYVREYARWVDLVRPIPHSNVADFLAGFDLVIGQMRQGVLGLMEIEALAAGRPLITALDEALYAGDPPPLVRATSPDEIVAAVEGLRNDSGELARLSASGREWAIRNHSPARHLDLLLTAYFGSPQNQH
jgi:glycosyltransferase involved in cell wall biosynthesis